MKNAQRGVFAPCDEDDSGLFHLQVRDERLGLYVLADWIEADDRSLECAAECIGQSATVRVILIENRGLAQIGRRSADCRSEAREDHAVERVTGDDAERPLRDAAQVGRRGCRGYRRELSVVNA